MQTAETTEQRLVAFEYAEITDKNSDISEKIEKAFGPNGLGLCIVKGVPGYVEKREQLLPLGHKLAKLPKEELDKIEFPDIHYSLGWSHGKEKFKGREDFSKGSFYANAQQEDRIPKYEDNEHAVNVNPWPETIPDLKTYFKDLGQLIVDVGTDLAHHIDTYVEKKESKYEKGKLTRILKEADNVIGRLLHYFPREKVEIEDPWCGLHNDHGSLTGLCGAMYLDKDGKPVDFVDEESGLHVLSRDGQKHRIKIPKDCLAFQIGETMQIHTGGHVIATPHYVMSGNKIAGTGISRNTLAVFMEPRFKESMKQPEGIPASNVLGKEYDGVPLLEERWNEKQIFHEFHEATIKKYS